MLLLRSVAFVLVALPSCLGMWARLTGSSSSTGSGRSGRQQPPPPPATEMPPGQTFDNNEFGAVHIPLGDDDSANLLYPQPPLDRNMYTQTYSGYPLPPDASMYSGLGSSSFDTDPNTDPNFQPYQQPFQGADAPSQYGSYYQPYGAYASYNQPGFQGPLDPPHQQTSYFHGASSTIPYAMPPSFNNEEYGRSSSAAQTTQALHQLNLGDAPLALQRVRTGGSSRVVSGAHDIGSSSSSGARTSRSHRVASADAELQQEEQRQMPHTARVRRPPRTDAAPSARTVARRTRESKRAWLIEQWQEKGMNTELMEAQELAQEVTELKIRHPDRSTSIAIMSAHFVEEERGPARCAEGLPFNLDNEEYVYDYTTWMNTYTQKLNKTKEHHGANLSPDELQDLQLRTFRSVRPRHHATLADPDREREQQMIAVNVWNDFMAAALHDYLGHAGPVTAQQDMLTIVEAGRHYRYITMDHKESQRYIRKYLSKMARWRPCYINHLEALQKRTLDS